MPNELPVKEESLNNFDEDSEETQDTLSDDEEEQDTEEQDTKQEDETEESDEDSEAESEEDIESYESEKDWIKEQGLPGDLESINDVASAYKEAIRKLNELQRNKPEETTPDINPLKVEQKPASFFKTNMATDTIEQMVKSGNLDEESAKSWKGVAKVMDESFNPFVQKVESVLNNFAQMNMSMVGELRESSWRRFQHKDLAKREELDSVLKKTGDFDYNRAFKRMLVSDEDLVSKFANKQQKRGEQKSGKKKTLPRFTTNRRSKSVASKPGINIKEYLNPDKTLNDKKLGELPSEKRLKIVDYYLSQLSK